MYSALPSRPPSALLLCTESSSCRHICVFAAVASPAMDTHDQLHLLTAIASGRIARAPVSSVMMPQRMPPCSILSSMGHPVVIFKSTTGSIER